MSALYGTDADALRAFLDVHGAAPADWPEDRREAVLAAVREDPRATAVWNEALALEAALDALTVPEPDPGLARRIAVAAADGARPRGAAGFVAALREVGLAVRSPWHGAALAMFPLAVGFLIGLAQATAAPPAVDPGAELAWISLYGLVEPAGPAVEGGR